MLYTFVGQKVGKSCHGTAGARSQQGGGQRNGGGRGGARSRQGGGHGNGGGCSKSNDNGLLGLSGQDDQARGFEAERAPVVIAVSLQDAEPYSLQHRLDLDERVATDRHVHLPPMTALTVARLMADIVIVAPVQSGSVYGACTWAHWQLLA